MRRDAGTTTCSQCGFSFGIDGNRRHRITRKYAPFWFFDAVRQFERFNEVECPKCGFIYLAPEARLFGIFKSARSVVILCLVLVALMVVYLFWEMPLR